MAIGNLDLKWSFMPVFMPVKKNHAALTRIQHHTMRTQRQYRTQKEKKTPLFKYFLEDYDHLIGDQTLIMGDMNTGLSEDNSTGKGFYCNSLLVQTDMHR